MSRLSTIRLGLWALAALPPLSAAAEAGEIACPATYAGGVAELPLIGTIKAGAALDAIAVIVGRPGDEAGDAPATLAPDDEKTVGQDLVQNWPLVPADLKDGMLLVCRYQGQSGYLRYPLAMGMTACTARLRGADGRFRVIAASCR